MSGEAKEIYTAVYKCRLCGEDFTTCCTGRRAKAAGMTLALTVGVEYDAKSPTMHTIHYCENREIGIADFQGWKIKES